MAASPSTGPPRALPTTRRSAKPIWASLDGRCRGGLAMPLLTLAPAAIISSKGCSGGYPMKARNFRYIRPSSLDQACRILAEGGGDAVPVAGGQSLLAGLNMRLSAPKLLVDIGDLKELTGQSYED